LLQKDARRFAFVDEDVVGKLDARGQAGDAGDGLGGGHGQGEGQQRRRGHLGAIENEREQQRRPRRRQPCAVEAPASGRLMIRHHHGAMQIGGGSRPPGAGNKVARKITGGSNVLEKIKPPRQIHLAQRNL